MMLLRPEALVPRDRPRRRFWQIWAKLGQPNNSRLDYLYTVRLFDKSPKNGSRDRVSKMNSRCKGNVFIVDCALNFNQLSPLTYILGS
jgi:hypothetical protein